MARLSETIPFAIHGEVIDSERSSSYSSLKEIIYDKIFHYGSYLFNYDRLSEKRYIENYLEYRKGKGLAGDIERLRLLQKNQYLGLNMFDVVRRYKMLLNYHISPVCAANLRMFEVTGMGTCLLTDWKNNLAELFEPDKEIVTFKNVEEAREKIEFLRKNPDVINSISLAGQKRTLKDHTYAKRAQDLHNIFSDYLKNHYKSN